MTVTPNSPRKPRNPLVAAARLRQAGLHRRSTGGERQLARQALRHELRHEHPPSP
ncbi:hypothetical protein AACH10_05415 [Ideonella sp. DXS22W]|uniref:Uncharacterized protein n=1 Tax=Pseudaquabacterium inlustre TaxID=2984192 RepID=A0ABU9CH57_9BURK